MHPNLLPQNRNIVLRWLQLCLALVALMVVVGGLTRLTESGLSMVEWKPATLLPPLSDAQWQEEFSKYQQSPEYQKINRHFGVAEFQRIFWLEYLHRLLGRVIGAVFLLPLLYFALRRMLPVRYALKLGAIFLLGGLQGGIGWYMVRSGLVDQPWVSPVRLALHLGMAFLLFGLIWWEILQLNSSAGRGRRTLWIPSLILLYTQILLGALVAGMDAGLVFNTFPTMNGEWMPEGSWLLEPWYRNFTENPTAAHFIHRLGAVITTIALFAAALPARAWDVLAVLALQIVLGALTVVYGVPILIASAHQAIALLLWALVIRRVAA